MIEENNKKTVLYIGDSFMNGGLATAINSKLRIQTSYNFSYGSTGFIRDTAGHSFLHQLSDASSSSLFDNGSITDIVIAGGINDDNNNSESQYTVAINSMKNIIETNFKNAKVWLVPLLWNTNPIDLGVQRKYDRLLHACLNSGYATYQDAYAIMWGLNPAFFMTDSVHPNAAGYDTIADYIASWISGGNCICERWDGASVSVAGNGVVNYTYVIRSGFLYINLLLYLRGHNYGANQSIIELGPIANIGANKVIACAKTVTAGSFNGDIYIKNGHVYANAPIGSCDVWVNTVIPIGFVY